MQVRTKLYSELPTSCVYFFTEDYPFDLKAVAKRLEGEGVAELLLEVVSKYATLSPFDVDTTNTVLLQIAEARGVGLGALVHPVRVAVSGVAEGPGLFEMLVLIGQERVCARLRRVAERVANNEL